jgi:hypothetical protein
VAVTYIAYTERNVLMLDGEGVCIRVEPLSGRGVALAGLVGRRPPAGQSDGALRCIGAQYVASIDPAEPGGLSHLPRAGTSMLFAAVDQSGRIFCVRAGPLTHFESSAADDSGVHSTPNDTQKEASIAFDDSTDPGLMPMGMEGAEDLETMPYRRPSSNPPPPPSSRHSMRGPPPPPVPRVPRLRPFVMPLSERQPQSVPRFASHSPISPAPYAGAGRGRPPSPSSHAWLRDSQVAVAPDVRRRG